MSAVTAESIYAAQQALRISLGRDPTTSEIYSYAAGQTITDADIASGSVAAYSEDTTPPAGYTPVSRTEPAPVITPAPAPTYAPASTEAMSDSEVLNAALDAGIPIESGETTISQLKSQLEGTYVPPPPAETTPSYSTMSDSEVLNAALDAGLTVESGTTTVSQLRNQLESGYVPPPPSEPLVSYSSPVASPTPTFTPPPLQNTISDTLVAQQQSYEEARKQSLAYAATINTAKLQLSAAYADPGKYERSSIIESQRQVDIMQAQLNKYNEQIDDYRKRLEAELLHVKTYGGLTDYGFARLDIPRFAAVYAGALKMRGVSATAVEQSDLSAEVKKQFASLGGLTAAGEAQPAKLERMREAREGGLTSEGVTNLLTNPVAQEAYVSSLLAKGYSLGDIQKSDLPPELKSYAQKQYGGPVSGEAVDVIRLNLERAEREEYARVGGLTQAGVEQFTAPEYVKTVVTPAIVQRLKDAGYTTPEVMAANLPPEVKSSFEARYGGVVSVAAANQIQRAIERYGGPTKFGESILYSEKYVEQVTNPALAARAADIERSENLRIQAFYDARKNLLKEAGYTVEDVTIQPESYWEEPVKGYTYYKPEETPRGTIYDEAVRKWQAGESFPRVPPKEGITITSSEERSLKERYLETATSGKPPKNLWEAVDQFNAQLIGSAIGFGEGVGRLALGVGYYVGSRGVRDPWVERQVSIGVPTGTAGVISEASRRLTGVSEVGVGPVQFAGARDVEFSKKYPVSAAADVALDLFMLRGLFYAGARGAKTVAVKGRAGFESFARKISGEPVRIARPAKPIYQMDIPAGVAVPDEVRLTPRMRRAAVKVDKELTRTLESGDIEGYNRQVSQLNERLKEITAQRTRPRTFSEPTLGKGEKLVDTGRGTQAIVKTVQESKLRQELKIAPSLKPLEITKLAQTSTAQQVKTIQKPRLYTIQIPKAETVQTTAAKQLRRSLVATSIKPVSYATVKVTTAQERQQIVTFKALQDFMRRQDISAKQKLAVMTRYKLEPIQQTKLIQEISQIQKAQPKQVTATATKQTTATATKQLMRQVQVAEPKPVTLTRNAQISSPITATAQAFKSATIQELKQPQLFRTSQIPKVPTPTIKVPPLPWPEDYGLPREFKLGKAGKRKIVTPLATAQEMVANSRRIAGLSRRARRVGVKKRGRKHR